MTCYACHSAWTTSCFGCHLSQKANQKKPNLHSEGGESRNWTSYNFQTLRDDIYFLARDGAVTKNRIAPARSACAVLVSSQNQNREWIYSQQQTVSAGGFSGTAFSTYVPHTVRTKETMGCTDCHVSKAGDNNAWMATLLMQGTGFVNFIGRYAYVGEEHHGFEAVVVTERDEPQAVIGSRLHEMAYPKEYAAHQARGGLLQEAYHHHGDVVSLQLRGEYLFAAQGKDGLRIYDVAQVDHKGFSERMVSAPVSPLGQKLYVKTKDATSVALPTHHDHRRPAQGPAREPRAARAPALRLRLRDRPRGRPGGRGAAERAPRRRSHEQLREAHGHLQRGRRAHRRHLPDPGGHRRVRHHPRRAGGPRPRRSAAPRRSWPGWARPSRRRGRWRCSSATRSCSTRTGLKVLDVTVAAVTRASVEGALVPFKDAHNLYLARTYAYVAAGHDGLAIVDIEKPEKPRLDQTWNAGGALNDAHDVKVGMTNGSAFAYVADGKNGLRVVQIISANDTPGAYGFSPRPTPTARGDLQDPRAGHRALARPRPRPGRGRDRPPARRVRAQGSPPVQPDGAAADVPSRRQAVRGGQQSARQAARARRPPHPTDTRTRVREIWRPNVPHS